MPKSRGDNVMKWYYAERKKPFGPIDEKEFRYLIDRGTILPDTLVWRSGMKEWKPLSEVNIDERTETDDKTKVHKPEVQKPEELKAAEEIETEYESVENLADCIQCGEQFDKKEMILTKDRWICRSCESHMAIQSPETTMAAEGMQYADFWIRAGAKIIDIFILYTIGFVVSVFLSPFGSPPDDPEFTMTFPILANFFQLIIAVSYTTYFLGKYAATPGKMAFNLKVVTPDGKKVAYSQACFRYFAEIISSLIFFIGYLMAIFDAERRTLHDRIANTRVVRNHSRVIRNH